MNYLKEFTDQIITCDAKEYAKLLPDESIDLILCDPVYQNIDDYKWLANVAVRLLKPYKSVIAQAGHIHRWEAEKAFQHPDLIKRPLLVEVFTGGWGSLWMHKVSRATQYYFWLEKTGLDPDRGWIRSFVYGRRDKSKHKKGWGDGGAMSQYLIERLTKPGDLIFDPFCGGGTVPSIAKKLDRHFIAFEIVPEQADIARNSVQDTQPSLPKINNMIQSSFRDQYD